MDLTGARAWVDNGDGWQELSGISRIAIDEQHQPIDGWPDVDAWITGWCDGPTPVELALIILRPHLAQCPLYVG